MAKLFTGFGHDVIIITHAARNDFERKLKQSMAQACDRVCEVERENIGVKVAAKSIASVINMHNVDVYIPNYRDAPFYALHYIKNAKAIALCHNNHESYYKKLIAFDCLLDAVIFPNHQALADCERALPEHNARYQYVPHYVDAPNVTNSDDAKNILNLIYFGRIEEEQKKIFEILKIAEYLNYKNINFNIRVIGDGTKKDEFAEAVDVAGLSNRIEIFESMEWAELACHISASNFNLLTSTYEGFCYSAAESMSLGVPVAAYENSAISDYVISGVNGLVVEWGDYKGLVNNMVAAFNSDNYSLLKKNSRLHIENNFSAKSVLAGYNQVCEDVSKNKNNKKWPVLRPKYEPKGMNIFGRLLEVLGKKAGLWR